MMKDEDALTDRKENLSQAKRALLELRLKKKRIVAPQIPPIVHHPRTEPIPLSFAQQRLWFLHQWEPTSTEYTISVAFRLLGPLHREALQNAINALVARHESLRTTFTLDETTPHQHIHPVPSDCLSILELPLESTDTQEAQILEAVKHEIQKPFDLSQGPLFRATLIGVTNQHHVLILVLHHIITDGWSMRLLYKELALLYDQYTSGTKDALPALPFQYQDFAVWQRRWLQGDVLESQLTYWKNQLHGMPAYLDIATDFPRPPIQSHKGASQTVKVGSSLTKALQTLSQRQGCTLFMTLLAAFQLLLARHTGQNDIVVGSPIANRTQQELEDVVGFFVNTLALRIQFDSHHTFRQVLARVQKVCLDAYTYQDLPFEKLVEELRPTRDPSRSPLIQTLFQVQGGVQTKTSFGGLEIERLKVTTSTSKVDLNVAFTEQPDGLTGHVEYDTALFQASTIMRLLEHFQILLEGLVSNPDQSVGELPLLSTDERTKVLETWNATARPYPQDQCVHQIFASQVALTPEAIAVACDQEQITYQQLDDRATLLGRYLQQLGVGTEFRVGLYLDRSIDMIVGLLGILKAGGTYVPLDPTYPRKRLAFMIRDAQIEVILSQTYLRDDLASLIASSQEFPQASYRVINLDTNWPDLVQGHAPLSSPKVNADNLAYVIYTSGSTGLPKGVSIPHRAIVRLVMNTDFVRVTSSDRIAHLANVSFDAATFEIWGSLLNGAKVVGLGSDIVLSPNRLHAEILDTGITIMFVTTALFNLLSSEAQGIFASLRCVLFGGEAANPPCVRAVLQHTPPRQLLHVYGPTECTTFSTWHHVSKLKESALTISIGRPIANTQVILLDRNQHLVPIGVPGDLFIGGAGLARGYLGQPALTAERFVPHGFSDQPGCRLYKSGDLARYHEDGTIEFLGRRDYQVKIRGFRIELGEVEMALSKHPTVHETLVLASEEESGEKRLVAYLVSQTETNPTVADLRHFLADKLPSYMIPTAFIWLDAFPIDPNGKVDRAKLPTAEQTPLSAKSYEAPRNAIETQVTSIWETILGRQPIGITDNFFDMGGESLLAVRLCAELEKAFPGKVSIPMIFQSQTVEQLSKIIQGETERAPWRWLIPIHTKGSKPPVFCVLFGATFMPYVDEFPTQPLYMLINQGHDGKPIVHKTVEEIATHYIKEIRTVQPNGPYFLAGYSFGGLVAYEMAQQLFKQGEVIGFLGLVDPTSPSVASSSPTGTEKLQRLLQPKRSKATPHHFFEKFKSIFSLIYVALQWRLAALTNLNILRNKFQSLACQTCFGLGQTLPASLRRYYRTEFNQQSSRRYLPKNYPGKITVFQSTSKPEIYWGKLCQNQIAVYNIPGEHLNIVEEPHVRTLLTKFMDGLRSIENIKL